MMSLPTDTKECCRCHKQMIPAWTGEVKLMTPPRRSWDWWCGCGRRQAGGMVTDPDLYERMRAENLERWRAANRPKGRKMRELD